MAVVTLDCWINLFVKVDTFSGVCIIVALWLLVLMFVMATTLTYKLACHSDNAKKNKKYLISLIIAPYWAFIALSLFYTKQVFWIHAVYPDSNINYSKMCPNINLIHSYYSVNTYFVVSCSFAYVSLINVYFQRFLGLFKNSLFKIAKIDHILVCIYFFINLATGIFAFVWLITVRTGHESAVMVTSLAIATVQLTYLFEAYRICHALKSKLISLMKLVESTKIRSFNSVNIGNKTSANNATENSGTEKSSSDNYIDTLSEQTIEIFSQTKRLTILSYATFISTFLCTIGNVLLSVIVIIPRVTSMSILIIAVLDGFINTLCVILQFPFTNKIYNNLCGLCVKLPFFNTIDQEIINRLRK